MAEKRRYTVTVPDHIAEAVERHASIVGATGTEYAADVLRWWFGQACPPVTHDEVVLRSKLNEALASGRIKPPPPDLNVWDLQPESFYDLIDGPAEKVLSQIGLPNLFAQAAEHDKVQIIVVFDNHPTHWLWFRFFKGWDKAEDNGLRFHAFSKKTVGRKEMLKRFQKESARMGSKEKPTGFSQIPMLEKKKSSNQTSTTIAATS